jgi:heat-inducible transcriptional repressor
MDPRQELILKSIIEEYIRTAEPVGSKFLAVKLRLGVSPATIRNDMMALEEAGYIRSPHTSAGRIPTEKGYEYYLRHFVESERERTEEERLRTAVEEADTEEAALKTLAKTLVDLSGETAIVAFDPRRSYYTGVSNLFQKPDFQDLAVVQSLSTLIDRFDEVMAQIFEAISREPQVMIGHENPFGRDIAAIMVKYRLPNARIGLIGLIGPMRMNYGKNLGLLEEAVDILHEEL